MDKRLPSRIRELRQQFLDEGKRCDSDSLRDALCRAHPEYARLKEKPLKKLIAQELSSAPPAAAAAPEPAEPGEDEQAAHGRKRKRRNESIRQPAGAPAVPEQSQSQADSEAPQQQNEPAEGGLNDSLRRMYGTPAPTEANGSLEERAARSGRLKRQRAAMAAARREHGLAEPVANAFTPEDRPEERLEDLGGIDQILDDLKQLVVYPLSHPEVFSHLGVKPPTGVLLHGPPGSGKSKLAHALAGSMGVPFFKVAATEVVSGMSGESEAKIRQLFKAAIESAPSLLFLDEVDAITPRRDSAGREMERRIVAQMLTCMDELQSTFVIVLAATNRPDALDPALRRAGRFDREIAMGIPDEPARARILEKMARGMRLADGLDLALLARKTPGFVGADLSALTKEAALNAVSRAFESLGADRLFGGDDGAPAPFSTEEMGKLAVEMNDFLEALKKVQPSARREGFTTIPDVSWEDVGALSLLRSELDAAVCEPIRKQELFKQLGLTVPAGVLLFGPPGCGKTLLAKAVANASGANFIAVKGPELLNKYVGESERAVRLVFQRALASSPCVIFFDELDAMVPRRSAEGSTSSERVVNQMLTEMDGVQQRSQVFVIAATNRPDIIDPAMLRPGRLDRLLYVPFPETEGRREILATHTRRLPLAEDVDLAAIASGCDGFSGADLSGLVREAAMLAIRSYKDPVTEGTTAGNATDIAEGTTAGNTTGIAEAAGEPARVTVTAEMFAQARQRCSPSVSAEERADYESLRARLCSGQANSNTGGSAET